MAYTNYDGVDAPFGILELGHTFMTEFAQEQQQIQKNDPILFALPQRAIPDPEVRVEWIEEELRLLGVIRSGQPNKLNTFGKAKGFNFTAAMFRRGDIIDMETVNRLRAPGKQQQIWGLQLVKDRLNALVGQANHMMNYLRAQLLSGGINYTDHETGNTIIADPGIPSQNIHATGSGLLAASADWHLTTTAKIVDDFQTLVFRMKILSKNPPKYAVMSSHMREMISRNDQVRSFLPGDNSGVHKLGLVTWAEDGKVASICGIKFIEHYMLFDDYEDANATTLTRKYMWPINKISFFAIDNPTMPGQTLGYSVLTKGENPAGEAGIYVRTSGQEELRDATLPPGLQMQVGMSGLPALWKPWWVHILTPCSEAELTGILGDTYV